jgi:hypothetical protein
MIMVFNNGLENLFDFRRSKVQAIDPMAGEVAWEYSSAMFFSSVGGTAQPLPGNNVLITSSHGGRVFEIRPGGRIVWEWSPPFLPMRVERVPYDHCPQLDGLPRPDEREIVPHDPRPLIDADLYRFEFKWDTDKRIIDGKEKRALRSLDDCRRLRIPIQAVVRSEFGLDESLLAGRAVEARFRLTIDDHANEPVTLFDVTIDQSSADLFWQRKVAPINRYAMKEITMCIETDVDAAFENPNEVVLWANPLILSKADRERRARRHQQITEQERRLREQQLKAIGYVD